MQRREVIGLAAAAGLAGCAAPGAMTAGPPALPSSVSRVAFGSCADQTRSQPIWKTVQAAKPDLVLFGGDNVYASAQPWSVDNLRKAYALQAGEANFAALRSAVPHLAIWDDHDFGLNDGGEDFAGRAESKAAFLDFWQAPANDPRRTREGIYHAQVFGPPGRRLQVILLDTRSFRSTWKLTDQRGAPGMERFVPDADPRKTMLGAAQWAWLEKQLRQPAEVRLVMSGMQVVAEGHGWERWGNFPLERERLYRLVGATRAQGVIFLSGDRHLGAIYRETNGAPYPMHDVTASGITHPWREGREAGPNRVGELYTDFHFGTVEVDWPAGNVHLAIRDMAGAAQRSLSIPLQQLRIPA